MESDFSSIWDRFGGHFGSQMGPKIEGKSMKNEDFLGTWLESDFSSIWDRFWGHFGSQMGLKIEEKSMKILIEIRSLIFEAGNSIWEAGARVWGSRFMRGAATISGYPPLRTNPDTGWSSNSRLGWGSTLEPRRLRLEADTPYRPGHASTASASSGTVADFNKGRNLFPLIFWHASKIKRTSIWYGAESHSGR